MKLKRIWITNYKEFRRTFEEDADADFVIKNLHSEAEKMIGRRCIDLSISAAYDDYGDALFDTTSFKALPNGEIIIEVKFTTTAK